MDDCKSSTDQAAVTLDLLKRYDRPGPRYTSYPTALEFHADFDEAEYRARLARADAREAAPLSLYVHVPFCEERCVYCGCHVVITRKRHIAERYLDHLLQEIDLLAAHLPQRRHLSQLHWGGGTPTYLAPQQLQALHDRITSHFSFEPAAEQAIEIDPRVTTDEQLVLLKRLGFNRISLGVQDLTPEVQEAVGRNQTEAQTRAMYARCRELGFDSINLDLIYGLPRQTLTGFVKSVHKVIEMRPDRVALYSFAYVPRIRAHQKRIDPDELPDPELKLQLFCEARAAFLEAGYVAIGMDHFALPEDELVLALEQGSLHRNFMGYTVRTGSDMVGVGVSAIGDVEGAFAQNEKKLPRYYEAIAAGRFPIEKGYGLSDDDLLRRELITRMMCNFVVDRGELERNFDIDFDQYFAAELAELNAPGGPVAEGLVRVTPERIEVVGNGRLFVRNVAMTFDTYLRARLANRPAFSRTI